MAHRALAASIITTLLAFAHAALAQSPTVGNTNRHGTASGEYPPAHRQAMAVSPVGAVGVAGGGTAQQKAAAAAQPGGGPRVPFQLTPAETAFRDQFLKLWETESAKIITFKCAFERWEYIRAFTPAGRDIPLVKGRGTLAYAKPDKGTFRIDEIHRWKQEEQNGALADAWQKSENEVGERWVCDGKDVYNYAHKEKQLQVSPIPQELQGKAIIDGPLPFLFGAKAEKLKQRYWIRIDPRTNEEEVWFDTYPKFLADAQNYKRVEMILSRSDLTPKAMQVYLPNDDRTVYMFAEPTVNSQLDRFFGVFQPPRTPFGWKRVVLREPQPTDPAQQPGTGPARDARRPVPRARY